MSGNYNGVDARLTLERKPAVDYTDPKNWPEEMTQFISRSFSKTKELGFNTVQKEQFQAQLKDLLNKAISENKVDRNDWKAQTMPIFNGRPFERALLACDYSYRPPKPEIQPQITKAPSLNHVAHSAETTIGRAKRSVSPVPTSRRTKLKGNPMLSEDRRNMRAQRFERELSTPAPEPEPEDSLKTDIDVAKPIIGTSTKIEKSYLRLTSQPSPENVRSPVTLGQALKVLREKVDRESDDVSYPYLCDQLKAIRQDLTVQHVKTRFTIEVYEFHAKLAMLAGDLGEFNQCLSQLKQLYATPMQSPKLKNFDEYMSYLVLYHLITNNFQELFNLRMELRSLTSSRNSVWLKLAFKIVDLCIEEDYYNLFRAHRLVAAHAVQQNKNSPNKEHELELFSVSLEQPFESGFKGRHWLWFFYRFFYIIVRRERLKALDNICKSYRLAPLAFLKEHLDLKPKQVAGFLQWLGIQDYINNDTLECHKCKAIVEGAMNRNYSKIDIKGQI